MLDKISGRILVALSLFLMLSLTVTLYSSYSDVQRAHEKNANVIQLQVFKKQLLTKMYAAARNRSLLLFLMSVEKDPFELDDLNQQMGLYARKFIKANEKLFSLQLSHEERASLTEQNEEIQRNASSQNDVAHFFINQQYDKGRKVLLEQIIPSQFIVFKAFDQVIEDYEGDFTSSMAKLEETKKSVNEKFRIFAILLLIGGLTFISFLIFYISRREKKFFSDQIFEQKKSAEKLSYQASHDPLTDLINRREFEYRLQQLLDRSEDDEIHAVLYLDLDQFKIVNDTCGHHAGDELLRQIPLLIEKNLRNSDLLARLGGDEFGIILMACEIGQIKKIAHEIIESISEFQFIWGDKVFKVGVSIGVVKVANQFNSLHSILKNADNACYAAKEAGRNQYKIYDEEETGFQLRTTEMDWLSKINQALKNDYFVLYAQPIVPTNPSKQSKLSYEVLVRLNDNGSLIPPGAFLPAAERYNQIMAIDQYVVVNTLSLMAKNKKFLRNIDHISINLSGLSITNKDFFAYLVDKVNEFDLSKKVCFEITETAVINDISNAQKAISVLHSMGVRFSLDDFGSGLSSFAYLKALDVDYLKIDGMFVKDIIDDPIDRVMVKSIREIGQAMGKKTIAEFVENDQVFQMLKEMGVDYAQGYGIGKPELFLDIIAKHTQSR